MDVRSTYPIVMPKIVDETMLPEPQKFARQRPIETAPAPDVKIDVEDDAQNDDKPSLGTSLFNFVNTHRTAFLIVIFAVLIVIFILYLFYFRREPDVTQVGPEMGGGGPPGQQMPVRRAPMRAPPATRGPPPGWQPQQNRAPEAPKAPETAAPLPDHQKIVGEAKEEDIQSLLEDMKKVNFPETAEPEKGQEVPESESAPEPPQSMIEEMAADEGTTVPEKRYCQGIVKNTGEKCTKSCVNGTDFCLFHGRGRKTPVNK